MTPVGPGLSLATFRRIALRGDLLSSYALTIVRVCVWAGMAAYVYRVGGAKALAAFTLARTAVTLMNYAGLGLAPALIVLLPQFRVRLVDEDVAPTQLNYQPVRAAPLPPPERRLFDTAFLMTYLPMPLLVIAALGWMPLLSVRSDHEVLAFSAGGFLALGTAIRLFGDLAGAKLVTAGRMALDNVILLSCEIMWLIGVGIGILNTPPMPNPSSWGPSSWAITVVGLSYIAANAIQVVARYAATAWVRRREATLEDFSPSTVVAASLPASTLSAAFSFANDPLQINRRWDSPLAKLLLITGGGILLSQLADLLYGPASLWIITRFLSAETLAVYAPTLHLDAALLLAVAGPAAVLLPRAAQLRAAGDVHRLRRDYLLGTIGSFAILLCGALFLWGISKPLFTVWFGEDLPQTRAILPWVLAHTVLGGTAAVGRSMLIGIGRIRAYTTAALIGGVVNVVLAIVLVTQTNLGLLGVIGATLFTVGVRCVIWMPWFTLRAIQEVAAKPKVSI
jgi:O-antigen/teichoic acid export membrane protein